MSHYKRKWRKGNQITSLDELAKQDLIYFGDKVTHAGWFGRWQFTLAKTFLDRGLLFYAVKNE